MLAIIALFGDGLMSSEHYYQAYRKVKMGIREHVAYDI